MGSTPLAQRTSGHKHGGRAMRPGPRFSALAVGAAVAALAAGCGSSQHVASAKVNPNRVVKGIGTIPSWLPLPNTGGAAGAGHEIVSATLARPVTSASQGDTVRAIYDGGVADITAVGPYVPRWAVNAGGNGTLGAAAVIPVSYRVTLKETRGTLPLNRQVFQVVLPTGQDLIPRVTPVGRTTIPSELRAGQALSLNIAAKLPGGNGVIRWAPAGHKALVTWTYQLELD